MADTYYEFAGGKVREVAVPEQFESMGDGHPQIMSLTQLSMNCHQAGLELESRFFQRIFVSNCATYSNVYAGFPNDAGPGMESFVSTAELRELFNRVLADRERALSRMIALQEEMDWLAYAAYGLLSEQNSKAWAVSTPESLHTDERPFRLWELGESKYESAIKLIPENWSTERQGIWAARLEVIRDNEHIRRIEQPIYKRRWDEQWKVGNQWRCGEIAYAAEFTDAFEWWLKEKAEWWLEHKKRGGPVEQAEWTAALWADERVQAAWPVAAENYSLLEFDKARTKAEEQGDPVPERPKSKTDPATFARQFKAIIEEETVPEGFEFGTEYEELARRLKKELPAKLKKVRGKLNVPRERFHSVGKAQYKWAGLQFRGKMK